MSKEIIICSAVIMDNGKTYRGHRHVDCIQAGFNECGTKNTDMKKQGFITSLNRYVDRFEGLEIHKKSKIKPFENGEYVHASTGLYSEDLY